MTAKVENQARMVREREAGARRGREIRDVREERAILTEYVGYMEAHANRPSTKDEDRRNTRAKVATARRQIRDLDTRLAHLDDEHERPTPAALPRTEHRYLRKATSYGYQPLATVARGVYRYHAYGCRVDGGPGLPAGRCGKCSESDTVEKAFIAALLRLDQMAG